MGEIFDNLRQNVEISDSTHIFHTNNSDTNNEQTVLPKIALPKYNGDYDGWRSFHDLFVALVHSNTRLKPVQKLYYLKTSLVGDAERLLRHTPITNEDYIPAYNKLKERYENTKILTNHQLKILTNQPKISSETATGLKSLLDTTEECLQQLKSLQIDTSSWDIIIVYLLVQKLPFNTLKLWEEQQGTSQALPTYTQFKLFLQTRLKVLEAISDTLGTKPSQTKVSPRHPTSTIAYHAIRSAKCSLCQDEHPLWECNKYLAMDIKSKHRFIASKGRCYNCLSTGHSTKGCPSTYRCRHCKERHHTTLHDDARSSSCSSSVETQARRPLQQTTPNNSTNDPQSSKAAITQTYMSRGRTPVLLSTALVTVYGSQNRSQVLRCLIDSGSESSFITHQACKKLKAICYPTSITVAGLNTANTSHSNKKTRLKLHSCGTDKTIVEEEFLVIPKITEYLPSCALPQETCDKFLRLELADPTYWRPGKVDVLLGAKVYAQIIREGIMQGTDTTPTAIKTTLGWILLGPVGNSNHWNSKSFMTTFSAANKQLPQFWKMKQRLNTSIQAKEGYKTKKPIQTSHKHKVKLQSTKDKFPALSHDRNQTSKRFEILEKQVSNNPTFKEKYQQRSKKRIKATHTEEADPPPDSYSYYYTPHHVIHKRRTSSQKNKNLWWHGPPWRSQSQNNWPRHEKVKETSNQKTTKIKNFLTHVEDNILLKYSNFNKLIRIVATLQRFLFNCRNPNAKRLGILTTIECTQAKQTILKLVQQAEFHEDYQSLIINSSVPRTSKLLKLSPFIDKAGLIRVGGRLDNALLSYNRRHPIILPRDHHVTKLIIDQIHRETLHGGTALVLNTSRDQYWILDARRCITSRLHKCLKCFKQRQETGTQLMGNLPAVRVTTSKPFTKVGIDYAGPVTIKTGPYRQAKLLKAYFCIFVCMVTKAIHIELVSNLTSDAFIAALKRFIARRGLCTDIYSDCGTNFIGAKTIIEREIREALKHSWPNISQFLTEKTINWHFNPPASPHFGGLWEAGVKSIKYHLRRVIGNSTPTFEEYATILTQIESCLNSRPLCYIQNNPDDKFVLTPGHFLIGQPLNAIPEPNYQIQCKSLTHRWKQMQQIIQRFWYHWSKDYLNQLQNRPKWTKVQGNITKGDVVLLKNENTPPNVWPLGIIQEVFPGNDGLVRVVEVKTQASTFKRPINKICRLPMNDA